MNPLPTEELVPKDFWGFISYTLKYAGPTVLICGVLLFQNFTTQEAIMEQQVDTMEYQRELTGRVVDGLNNSTKAVQEMSKNTAVQTEILDGIRKSTDTQTIILGQKLDKNNQKLIENGDWIRDNTSHLGKIIDRQDIIIEHSKNDQEN